MTISEPLLIDASRRSSAHAPMVLINWIGATLPGRYRERSAMIGTIVTAIPAKKRIQTIVTSVGDGRRLSVFGAGIQPVTFISSSAVRSAISSSADSAVAR